MSDTQCCRTCLGSINLIPIFDARSDSEAYTEDLFATTGIKNQDNLLNCSINMSDTQCCRTCLGSINLIPIFDARSDSEAYTEDLFATTGIKIQKGDSLSQVICTECITFVNSSIVFRKKCKETNEVLLKVIEDKNNIVDKTQGDELCIDKELIESEGSLDDLFKMRAEIIFDNIKRHKKVDLNFMNVDVKEEIKSATDETEEQIKCEVCLEVFKTKKDLVAHRRIHAVKVMCEYCGKKVKDERALQVHYKAIHGHQRTDKCRFCDYLGTKPELVRIHERKHTGEKPYVCACGAGFHRKSSYLQHTPLHLPDKTVKCDDCPAMFKSVTLMRIHKSSRHRRRRAGAAALH